MGDTFKNRLINCCAESVKIVSTFAPNWVSLLARSMDLYDAMLPVTPNIIFLFFRGWLVKNVSFQDSDEISSLILLKLNLCLPHQ